MFVVLLSIAALLVSLSLYISGNVMLGTIIALRLDLDGVDETVLGTVLAIYSLGFIFGAAFSVRIIRKVGHIRAFAAFAAIACAASLLHPIWVSPESWAVMRFLVGFSIAGLLTVTESWINDRATNDTRGKVLGVYTIVLYVASAVGQFLVALGDPQGFAVFSLVAILLALSLVPLALTSSLVPTIPAEVEYLSIRRLLQKSPTGMSGVFVAGIALGSFVALGPVFALRIGLDVTQLSIYMAFSVMCAVFLPWPAGWLSDRIGRIPVLLALLVMAAIASIGVAYLSASSIFLMFALSGLFYAISTAMYPISIALANDRLRKDQLVPASAALLRIYGIGTMLGPLVGAFLMGQFGETALFLFIALVLLAAATAIHLFFKAGDEVALEEQVEYAVVPHSATPVITELDPRNEDYTDDAVAVEEMVDLDIADMVETHQATVEALEEEIEVLEEEKVVLEEEIEVLEEQVVLDEEQASTEEETEKTSSTQ